MVSLHFASGYWNRRLKTVCSTECHNGLPHVGRASSSAGRTYARQGYDRLCLTVVEISFRHAERSHSYQSQQRDATKDVGILLTMKMLPQKEVHGAEGVPWGERSGVEAGLTALVGCWPRTRAHTHTHTSFYTPCERAAWSWSTWFLGQAQLERNLESAFVHAYVSVATGRTVHQSLVRPASSQSHAFALWRVTSTYPHTHTHTHTRTRTHAHAHTHTHTHTHRHTHTHTHTGTQTDATINQVRTSPAALQPWPQLLSATRRYRF
jgi:hypothetical protein